MSCSAVKSFAARFINRASLLFLFLISFWSNRFSATSARLRCSSAVISSWLAFPSVAKKSRVAAWPSPASDEKIQDYRTRTFKLHLRVGRPFLPCKSVQYGGHERRGAYAILSKSRLGGDRNNKNKNAASRNAQRAITPIEKRHGSSHIARSDTRINARAKRTAGIHIRESIWN